MAERGATDGHADRFWAMALAALGAASAAGPFEARMGRARPGPRDAWGGGGYRIDAARGMVVSPIAAARPWGL